VERFVGREVEVEETRGGLPGLPRGRLGPAMFVWEGRTWLVVRVIRRWADWKFAKGAGRARNWRTRHHRDCFRVRTESGDTFELYRDRGAKVPVWVLRTHLPPPEGNGEVE